MRLLAACLCNLDVSIFPLEAARLLLAVHGFFNEVLRPILLVDSGAVIFCRSFNNCTSLRKGRYLVFASVLLVMSVRVEHGAHLDHLEIALELWGHNGLGKVEPLLAGVSLVILFEISHARSRTSCKIWKAVEIVRVTMNNKSLTEAGQSRKDC